MPRQAKLWKRAGRAGWWATISGRKVMLGLEFAVAEKEFHRRKAVGKAVPCSRLTVEALVDLFLDAMRGEIKETTWTNYRWHLQRWCNHSGSKIASQLKPFDAAAWLKSETTWNSSTKRAGTEIIRQWSRWCKNQGYLDADRLAGTRYPKSIPRAAAPMDDIERFIAGIREERFRDLVLVLLDTGARPGEIRTLTAARIDWKASSAVVEGKSGARVIGLTARSLEILRRAADQFPDGPVLRNGKGDPWQAGAMTQRFRRVRNRVKVYVVPYHFRHALFGRASKAGVDSVVIARQLGHANLNMLLKVYSHVDAEQMRAAVDKTASKTQDADETTSEQGAA
jgi:integrase